MAVKDKPNQDLPGSPRPDHDLPRPGGDRPDRPERPDQGLPPEPTEPPAPTPTPHA